MLSGIRLRHNFHSNQAAYQEEEEFLINAHHQPLWIDYFQVVLSSPQLLYTFADVAVVTKFHAS